MSPSASTSKNVPASQIEDLVLADGGACGVFAGGATRCWGDWYGKYFPECTAANGLTDVVELRVGQNFIESEDQLLIDFFCARFSGGTVQCWGNGYHGQLGTDVGAGGGVMVPKPIEGMPSNIAELALGWRHACARTGDGEVVCWGSNEEGQLGIGATTGEKVTRPSPVQLPSPAVQLVATINRTCALLDHGDVYCWGEYWSHEPGQPPSSHAWWPKLVPDVRGSRQLTAASSAICAIRLNGRIACWGPVSRDIDIIDPTRVDVPDIDDATGIAVGESHACAIRSNGTLWCWGRGTNGELGDGRRTSSRRPVLVPLPGPVIRVVAGDLATCARLADHRWFCWGANRNDAIAPRDTGPIISPRLLDPSEL